MLTSFSLSQYYDYYGFSPGFHQASDPLIFMPRWRHWPGSSPGPLDLGRGPLAAPDSGDPPRPRCRDDGDEQRRELRTQEALLRLGSKDPNMFGLYDPKIAKIYGKNGFWSIPIWRERYIYTPFTRDGLLPMILGEVLANSMSKSNILREVSGQLYSQRPLFQWPSWHATKWQKPKKHQCFSKICQKDWVSSLAEIALARKAHFCPVWKGCTVTFTTC